jgi:hypothetical protein
MSSAKSMMVVGAGLGRTGTTSLKNALEILLPGKCYHMEETLKYRDGACRKWVDFLSERLDATDAPTTAAVSSETKSSTFTTTTTTTMSSSASSLAKAKLFYQQNLLDAGYVAGVDMPICACYEEIMQLYPDCKVILSVREDEKAWWRSNANLWSDVDEEVFTPFAQRLPKFVAFKELTAIIRRMTGMPAVTKESFQNSESWINYYRRWNQQVIERVPRDRLLIWNVKDGWAPLCKFLNVPIPSKPFPHFNEGGKMASRMRVGVAIEAVLETTSRRWFRLLFLLLAVMVLCYWYFDSIFSTSTILSGISSLGTVSSLLPQSAVIGLSRFTQASVDQ